MLFDTSSPRGRSRRTRPSMPNPQRFLFGLGISEAATSVRWNRQSAWEHGGQGWLRRTYGMTCDALVSVDLVTAEGSLLDGQRGEKCRSLLGPPRGWRELRCRHILRVPPVRCWAHPFATYARSHRRNRCRQDTFTASSRMSWVDLQQMFDPFYPNGELHYYWRSLYLDSLDEEVIQTIDAGYRKRPSAMSQTIIWALGGAMDRVGENPGAIGKSEAPFSLEILSNWKDPADTEANIAWARELYEAMKPFSSARRPSSGSQRHQARRLQLRETSCASLQRLLRTAQGRLQRLPGAIAVARRRSTPVAESHQSRTPAARLQQGRHSFGSFDA